LNAPISLNYRNFNTLVFNELSSRAKRGICFCVYPLEKQIPRAKIRRW